jgi:hypothetical protein
MRFTLMSLEQHACESHVVPASAPRRRRRYQGHQVYQRHRLSHRGRGGATS